MPLGSLYYAKLERLRLVWFLGFIDSMSVFKFRINLILVAKWIFLLFPIKTSNYRIKKKKKTKICVHENRLSLILA